MRENTDGKEQFRIMVSAPSSNSGKTAVTCGLLEVMRRRGKRICAFKCGPDYIDPMFHRSVLDVESRNLDVFLAGEEGVKEIFRRSSADRDGVICEGVMGYYDGIGGGSAKASAWDISGILDIPSLLVVRPGGSSLSLAAVIKGMAGFREPSNIEAVVINDCSPSFYEKYGRLIEEESGVPVVGYLPPMAEAEFESRHLGLMTSSEISGLKERITRIAQKMEETIDIDRLIRICSKDGHKVNDGAVGHKDGSDTRDGESKDRSDPETNGVPIRIAVARDEAFCFIYQESLDALERHGAELIFYSPVNDEVIPADISGIYIPGGYPELYADKLSKNISMRESVRDAVEAGVPTIAECGGFLYLGRELEDDKGRTWPMAGVLPGSSKNAGHLVRFGYGTVRAKEDSMLFSRDDEIPVHEFHYWESSENGSDLELVKASNGNKWKFGFASKTMYAGFPHLYLAGKSGSVEGRDPVESMDLAERFVAAAARYRVLTFG